MSSVPVYASLTIDRSIGICYDFDLGAYMHFLH